MGEWVIVYWSIAAGIAGMVLLCRDRHLCPWWYVVVLSVAWLPMVAVLGALAMVDIVRDRSR